MRDHLAQITPYNAKGLSTLRLKDFTQTTEEINQVLGQANKDAKPIFALDDKILDLMKLFKSWHIEKPLIYDGHYLARFPETLISTWATKELTSQGKGQLSSMISRNPNFNMGNKGAHQPRKRATI